MEIEDVTWVRLTAGRPAEQECHLAVRPGVLGEVVVHAQRVLDLLARKLDAVLHDLLAHGDSGVGREVLQRGGVLGAGNHHDRVAHRAVLLEGRDGLGDRGQLLADRHVDADEALAFLVDDRVDGDRALARLAVADDQLTLAAPDRDERVDRLDAGLDRRVDGLADDDARRDPLDRTGLLCLDGTLVVQRLPEWVDDTPEKRLTHGHLDDASGRLDRVAFLDRLGVAQDHDADRLLLEVEGHAHHAARELDQLGGQRRVQAIDLRDAIAHLDHSPDVPALRCLVEPFDRVLDDADDFVRLDGHRTSFAVI